MNDNGKTLDDVAVLELRQHIRDSTTHHPLLGSSGQNWPKTGRSTRRDKGMRKGLQPGSNRAKVVEAWNSGIKTAKEIAELLNINVRSVRTELPKLERAGYIQGYINNDRLIRHRRKNLPSLPTPQDGPKMGVAPKDTNSVVDATIKSIYVVECPCCKAVIRVRGLRND